MIDLQPHAEGVLLPIHAQPGSRRNGITGEHDGRLKVAVTQIAEKGKANKEILKVLTRELGLKGSQVKLISGETSPKKSVLVAGETVASLRQRLPLFEAGPD